MHELAQVAYLFTPLLVGLITHGFCIRFGWLSFLAMPIDSGRVCRGKPLFGRNKTYRGVAAVALGSALMWEFEANLLHDFRSFRQLELVDYSEVNAWVVGFMLGAAAMLAELPNSFIKRQLGIAPGQSASGVMELALYVLDQIDLLIGAWLVLAFVVPVTLSRILWSVFFFFVAHQIISLAGHRLGMRATAR